MASVLRATGYLARIALNHPDGVDPAPAVEALTRHHATLAPGEDRSVVVGLTTALGFLGRWQPILEHLGSGEPWMHLAALNIFRHWVHKPPEGTAERRRAQDWIKHRLLAPDLPPEVRTTLLRIREELAKSIDSY